MHIRVLRVISLIGGLLLTSSTMAATTEVYDVSTGMLTGIRNVIIEDYGRYDATLSQRWSGDRYEDAFARNATYALYRLYTPGGIIGGALDGSPADLDPSLMTPEANQTADIISAFMNTVGAADTGVSGTFVNVGGAGFADDLDHWYFGDAPFSEQASVFLDWERSAPVPIPAAAWLFMSALGFLGVSAGRPRKSVQ